MKKKIALLIAILMLMSIFAACAAPAAPAQPAPTPGGDTAAPDDAEDLGYIIIGNIQDISGPTSVWGQSYQWGAEYAAAKINAAGGVLGRNIRIITYDLRGNDVNEGINAYNRLAQVDGAVAAMVMASNVGIVLAPLSDEVGLPMVHSAMDERATTRPDGTPYQFMFLTQLSAPQQGRMMGMFAMNELGVTRAAVLYDNSNAYATTHIYGGSGGFLEFWEANGGEIVAIEAFDGVTDRDYRALLGVIQAANPEVLFISSFVQQNAIAYQQARAMGLDIPIIGNNSFFIPFADVTEGRATNVYFPSNMNYQDPVVSDFVAARIAERGMEPSNHFFFGYDNVHIIVDAINRAGTTDRVAVAAALSQTTDIVGWTGSITINPETHRPTGLEKWITRVEGFEYVPIMAFAMGDDD